MDFIRSLTGWPKNRPAASAFYRFAHRRRVGMSLVNDLARKPGVCISFILARTFSVIWTAVISVP